MYECMYVHVCMLVHVCASMRVHVCAHMCTPAYMGARDWHRVFSVILYLPFMHQGLSQNQSLPALARQTRAPAVSHPCLPWAEMIIEESIEPVTAEITDECHGAFNCGDLNPQLHTFAVST